MAVVGQGYAVLQTGRLHLKGMPAWLAWMVVHLAFLAQPGLRISVTLQWLWTFVTRQRGDRLIVGARDASRPAEAPRLALNAKSA